MPKDKQKRLKTNKKAMLVTLGCIVLILGTAAQIIFNIFVWKALDRQSTFQLATLIHESISGLDALYQSPLEDQKIPEAKLVLPQESTNIKNIRYMYYEPNDNQPASLMITTNSLISTSGRLLSTESTKELLRQVPIVQACARGFTIFIDDTSQNDASHASTSLVLEKKLNDGRTIQIWREKDCNDSLTGRGELMNDLEQYLAQIQSY